MKKLGLGLIIALLVLIMVPVAQALDQTVNISATVDQSLTFTISSTTISFGTLDSTKVRFANDSGGSDATTTAHTMTAATNATGGYTITVAGETLSYSLTGTATDTISAIGATAASPSVGVEQFGINLTESGDGSPAAQYGISEQYAFLSTDTVASNANVTGGDIYSVSYLANIAPLTEAGSYATTLTYTATGSY